MSTTPSPPGRASPLAQVRVWHLGLLVAFVAVAIVNIQDQRVQEPALIGLASAGFVLYGLIGWLGWRFSRRFAARLGSTPRLVLYLVAMSGFFLAATAVYLVLEFQYTTARGRWPVFPRWF